MNVLEKLQDLDNRLRESNSTNAKKKVLESVKSDQELLNLIALIYNPFKQFHISSDNIKKNLEIDENSLFESSIFVDEEESEDIFELLNWLSEQKACSNEIISRICSFVNKNLQYKELLFGIFDKNLKNGVKPTILNKVFGENFIPSFNVALANRLNEKNHPDFKNERWYAQRKMDGVRIVAIIDGKGEIKFYSRNGKEIYTLDLVKNEIKKLRLKNYVLDGEICKVYTKDGEDFDDFQGIMKEIRRLNHTIKNPRFYIFDILKIEDFFNKTSKEIYSKRISKLDKILNNYNGKILKKVYSIELKSNEHLEELIKLSEKSRWEGLILRKDAPYQGKRSDDLLKVKKFKDAEYIVEDVEFGNMQVLNEDGDIVEENLLRNVFIKHKGNIVRVGSGFSIDQRRYYKEHPEELIGVTITVKYFEETKNQDGNYSLRFPVVKIIHGKNGRLF